MGSPPGQQGGYGQAATSTTSSSANQVDTMFHETDYVNETDLNA